MMSRIGGKHCAVPDAIQAAAALKTGLRNKTDRYDARGMADLVQVNKLRAVWVRFSDKIVPFDQLHYHGTETVRLAAALLGLGPKSHVLDIGSGFGGPARHLAHSTGCRVTAIELQSANTRRLCG